MNVYFLVEGKTERKVYPKWLSSLVPDLKRVDNPVDVDLNNYYLISGGGYPSLLNNHLIDSVADVNNVGRFDLLVLVIDTDDQSTDEKIAEVKQFVKDNNIKLEACRLVIVPQVICMETWFLGNNKIYPRVSPTAECSSFANHYNISKYDPELMKKPSSHIGSNADFHYEYLKVILKSKNIRYSKNHPQEVHEAHYINELKNRIKSDPAALKSMARLFAFFDEIQASCT